MKRTAAWFWTAILVVALTPLVARALDESDVQRCAAIEDRAERLDCYDALAGRPMPDPVEEFGLPPRVETRAPDWIQATVSRVYQDPYGKTILELANGQVWKVVDRGAPRIRGNETQVIIEKALLGSYMLRVQGDSGMHRVKRIQ